MDIFFAVLGTALTGLTAWYMRRQTQIFKQQTDTFYRQTAIFDRDVKLALYDKRFQVFEQMMHFVNQVMSKNGAIADMDVLQFRSRVNHAEFLFGEDVWAYINGDFSKNAWRLEQFTFARSPADTSRHETIFDGSTRTDRGRV